MIARARQTPATTVVASNAPAAGEAGVGSLVGGVRSLLGLGSPEPAATMAPPRGTMTAALQPSDLRRLTPPLPPARPDDLGNEALASNLQLAEAPLPPRRPDNLASLDERRAIRLPAMITGSQPILPTTFTAYAPLR